MLPYLRLSQKSWALFLLFTRAIAETRDSNEIHVSMLCHPLQYQASSERLRFSAKISNDKAVQLLG